MLNECLLKDRKNPYYILYYIFIVPHQKDTQAKKRLLLYIAKQLIEVNKPAKRFVLNFYY